MTILAELREQALKCREKAMNEPVLETKRALYRKSLELAHLAEKAAHEEVGGLSLPRRRGRSP
jgi:hypothetical protein